MKICFRLLGCLCVLMLCVACSQHKSKGILSESKMEDVLYDYNIAQAMCDQLPPDEKNLRRLYLESVYKKHGITEATFDSSMVWYTRNAKDFEQVYEHIVKRMKSQQEKMDHLVASNMKQAKRSQAGDSIDVWAWTRSVALNGQAAIGTCSSFSFLLPSDINFHDRDAFAWTVRYHYPNQMGGQSPVAIMVMQIAYANDSVVSNTYRILRSGPYTIRLQADNCGAIKEVRGFIFYQSNEIPSKGVLLADNIKLIRYHTKTPLPVQPAQQTPKVDTVQHVVNEPRLQRIDPNALKKSNRPILRTIRPEQIKVEQHIEQERQKIEQQRRMRMQRQRPMKRRTL